MIYHPLIRNLQWICRNVVVMERRCLKSFNIKLANRVICIKPMHEYIREYCKDYKTDEVAEFMISREDNDISYEREKSKCDDIKAGISIRVFKDEYLELLAVYRKIVEKLIEHNIVLFHGSAVSVDGQGYLFVAPSGTGKSTHTRLWRESFGERVVMINDDKPLISVSEVGVIIHGTPWRGKHNLGINMSVPLKAICILERSKENHIEKITNERVFGLILQHVYRPRGVVAMIKTMEILDSLVEDIELYRLGCNKEPEAARVAFEGMNGGLS